jgi:hypothetical protein
MARDFLGVGEVAAQLGRRPRDISDAFYAGLLDGQRCPLISGRRLIPASYVGVIREVLARVDRRRREATPAG